MQVNIAAARTRHCNGDILALSNLSPGYDEEQTSSLASLKARWPAKQTSRNAWRFVPFAFIRECISSSMATLVFIYRTAIVTNRGPTELIKERIFYALQVMHLSMACPTIPLPRKTKGYQCKGILQKKLDLGWGI